MLYCVGLLLKVWSNERYLHSPSPDKLVYHSHSCFHVYTYASHPLQLLGGMKIKTSISPSPIPLFPSSLSVGTKLGYKLFPLTTIERRLDPSFEKGSKSQCDANHVHVYHVLVILCSNPSWILCFFIMIWH